MDSKATSLEEVPGDDDNDEFQAKTLIIVFCIFQYCTKKMYNFCVFSHIKSHMR